MALLLVLLTPVPALAHAGFVRSEPPDLCAPLAIPRLAPNDPRCETGIVLQAAPTAIHIAFSEPVQLIGRGIRVVAPSGRPASTGRPGEHGPDSAA